MVGFEIFLDVVAVCFVFLLVGRDRSTPTVEVEAEAQAEVKEAIVTVPDVDLPSIGELFAEADQVGDRYLTPSEIEERNVARAAIAEVFTGMPPHRPGGGRRQYIDGLLARSRELRERELMVDAAAFTMAQVAIDSLG
jgi:hypothetical protein